MSSFVIAIAASCGGSSDDGLGAGADAGADSSITDCTSDKDCTPLGLLCDRVLGVCVECVADTDCDAPERCAGGACRPPCRSDKDCTSLGLLCDRDVGVCVECVTETDCRASETCREGTCVPDGAGGAGGASGASGASGVSGMAGTGGSAGDSGSGTGFPGSCADAASQGSAIGCEFWPTVSPTSVWRVFDFAVAVVNPSGAPATVDVHRDGALHLSQTVPSGGAEVLYLPWVDPLRTAESDSCGAGLPVLGSHYEAGGAYRITSDRPVAAVQFSPIEPEGVGGPPGKAWAACPGLMNCVTNSSPIGCFAFTGDASRLLPSSALGETYRAQVPEGLQTASGGFLALTATASGTSVTVAVPPGGDVRPGPGVPVTSGGGVVSLTMAEGDVALLVSSDTTNLSGALIQASAPLQAIAGSPCLQVPLGQQACDHLEEVLPPTSALGREYLVARPTGPLGNVVDHVVRIVGTVNGTSLTFPSGTPAGAPAMLNQGELVDLGVVAIDFELVANEPVIVTTYLQGGSVVDPIVTTAKGDPSLIVQIPTERWGTHHAFYTPPGWDPTYLMVVQPEGATVELDGVAIGTPEAIGPSGYGVARVLVGVAGAHVLVSTQPFSAYVAGYAPYASYAYPTAL